MILKVKIYNINFLKLDNLPPTRIRPKSKYITRNSYIEENKVY